MTSAQGTLGWFGIFRMGLVQTALGSIVVLTTSTMNRVMVVELALPAMLPGALVALHYAVQMLRPRLGHGSDVGGRRTPWIVGGMWVLGLGGLLAAIATAWMSVNTTAGVILAVVAFLIIGLGVGAAGTSLLVLLAKRVDPARRAPAATVMWVMMIMGFVITGGVAGHFLDPFTPTRLVLVTAAVAGVAVLLATLAVWNVEKQGVQWPEMESAGAVAKTGSPPQKASFRAVLAEVWAEPEARRFTVFVFVSMLAYSAQDLILEPFAGLIFGMTPGQSTQLAGMQNGGVMTGMVLVALAAGLLGRKRSGSLRAWTVAGCIGSAISLASLAFGGFAADTWSLKASVIALGLANGVFAVAAIASMMELAGAGRSGREGVRMGLWGAAQAVAFGLGGFLGTVAVDVVKVFATSPAAAYATVFSVEALLFCWASLLALKGRSFAGGTSSNLRTPVVSPS
jgi:BCD family chlorophyll transporter-like MFS transporter